MRHFRLKTFFLFLIVGGIFIRHLPAVSMEIRPLNLKDIRSMDHVTSSNALSFDEREIIKNLDLLENYEILLNLEILEDFDALAATDNIPANE